MHTGGGTSCTLLKTIVLFVGNKNEVKPQPQGCTPLQDFFTAAMTPLPQNNFPKNFKDPDP